jgi:hypothetical protein
VNIIDAFCLWRKWGKVSQKLNQEEKSDMTSSWKTSLVGVLGGIVYLIVQQMSQGVKLRDAVLAAAMALLGILAKDFNVTGGTTKLSMFLAIILTLGVTHAQAQTPAPTPVPTPTQSTLNFNVGSSIFGVGSQAAADVILQINPGIKNSVLKNLSFMTDSLLNSGANFQYYGGGVLFPIPKNPFANTALSPLGFYARGTVGIDRLAPPTGPGSQHIALMVGGGVNWKLANGVQFNIVEVDLLRAPGAPWGANAVAVSGGISYFFGQH